MSALWTGAVISVITGVVVNEACDLSPWLARRAIRRASRLWAADNPDTAAVYDEEWAAVLELCPGKLTKLILALWFLAGATVKAQRRAIRRSRALKHSTGPRREPLSDHRWFMIMCVVLATGIATAAGGYFGRNWLAASMGASEILYALINIRHVTNRGIRRAAASRALAESVLSDSEVPRQVRRNDLTTESADEAPTAGTRSE